MSTTAPNHEFAERRTAQGELIERLAVPPLSKTLNLSPHPEGGWFRQTWAGSTSVIIDDPSPSDTITPHDISESSGVSQRPSQGQRQRPTATLIIFYLPAGESSTWHRVKSDEIWIWNGMGKLELQLGGGGDRPDEGQGEMIQLGDPGEGREVQGVVPAGVWQRTLRGKEDVLVSCMVSPGFDFEEFEILGAE